MSESFSVIKSNPDGTYEMQTFYIVNESAAAKACVCVPSSRLVKKQLLHRLMPTRFLTSYARVSSASNHILSDCPTLDSRGSGD